MNAVVANINVLNPMKNDDVLIQMYVRCGLI